MIKLIVFFLIVTLLASFNSLEDKYYLCQVIAVSKGSTTFIAVAVKSQSLPDAKKIFDSLIETSVSKRSDLFCYDVELIDDDSPLVINGHKVSKKGGRINTGECQQK